MYYNPDKVKMNNDNKNDNIFKTGSIGTGHTEKYEQTNTADDGYRVKLNKVLTNIVYEINTGE